MGLRGIRRSRRRPPSWLRSRKHLLISTSFVEQQVGHTLGTSCDSDDESNKVKTECTEDLDPKGLEQGVLKVGIGRSHQDVGSLHHDEYECGDDDDSDALLVSSWSFRTEGHTWRTLPARKTSWEVPSENIPSSPVTSADSPPATSHSPPICMRTNI